MYNIWPSTNIHLYLCFSTWFHFYVYFLNITTWSQTISDCASSIVIWHYLYRERTLSCILVVIWRLEIFCKIILRYEKKEIWFDYLNGNKSAKVGKKTPIMIRTPYQLRGNSYNFPPITESYVDTEQSVWISLRVWQL